MAGKPLAAVVAKATSRSGAGAIERLNCIFYGWVIVGVCILCKIFKVQGQNNVMSYTVPHLLQEFRLSHAELGGLFSVATILAGFVQPLLGRAIDHFGARICIPVMQVSFCGALLVFASWTCPTQRLALYFEVVLIFFFLRTLSLGAAETFPNACVQQWFQRRRGRAVAVVFTFQWLGNAFVGPCVSGIVARHGWQTAALAGSFANLLLAPISATLLRRSPEVCGLLPDGWTAVSVEEPDASSMKGASEALPAEAPELRDLWPLFAFTFFYAVMFGGSDFYMVEMVAEAWNGDLDVSILIFGPMALTAALSTPLVGELMDARSSSQKRVPIVLLSVAGFVTAIATTWLTCISSRASAVLYGVIRGSTTGVFQSLLSAGLAFTALGVRREEIGRVLGFNQLSTLVGTGVGPFWYGTFRDVFGAFHLGLLLSALPPLMLGFFFAAKALASEHGLPAKGMHAHGWQSPEATSPNSKEHVVLGVVTEEEARAH
ncbi:pcaK [Symbiodinium natans]|uniref:PcaK protein n=1 Tax=Symbiodinium natans TaxID=878477 RepID=A0A812KCT3_9DINO|nr:pcaK [Symbiodinium natans]